MSYMEIKLLISSSVNFRQFITKLINFEVGKISEVILYVKLIDSVLILTS